MGRQTRLETLADVYAACTKLASGETQGKIYRFASGTGHVSYDGRTLEYDCEKCLMRVHPDTSEGLDAFRVDYSIYPSVVLEAIERKSKNTSIEDVFRSLVPNNPLRKLILSTGFEPTDEDGANCTIYAYDAAHVYKLIEAYIKEDPMHNGDKKTFIRQRKQQAKHERGKRGSASDAQHTRGYNGSKLEQPTADPAGSDPEPPGIAV